MPAYIIARVNVTDMARYTKYMEQTPGVIAKFGGRFIVRGGEKETLEGPKEEARVVVIEFPNLAKAKEFYRSPEYQKVKELRAGAATGQFLAIDGYAQPPW